MSRYTMSGIHRLKDGTLHLSKPLCLEYSIIDINLCDLLDLFHEAKDTVKSLLSMYYNLRFLCGFNLYALYNFIRIMIIGNCHIQIIASRKYLMIYCNIKPHTAILKPVYRNGIRSL